MIYSRLNISDRWCANCRSYRPLKNGDYVKANRGKTQRWFCELCLTNWKEKLVAAESLLMQLMLGKT